MVDAVGFRGEEDSLVSLNNKVLNSNFVFLIRLNGSVFTKGERKGNMECFSKQFIYLVFIYCKYYINFISFIYFYEMMPENNIFLLQN